MKILGIETSCDETAAAVLDCREPGSVSVVSEEVSSQVRLHEAYGGVVPELASREHLRNLPVIVDRVLSRAGKEIREMDLICVTRGPGLKGCLLVGVCFARGLAASAGIPLSGVNHIEAHLLSPMLEHPEISFPYLGLVISGGHTEIILVSGVGRYECLARTTDDAAGEAFDKAAALLDLPYPGGPTLAALGDTAVNDRFHLPRVMREAEGFSFSGLKTAISILVRRNSEDISRAPEIRAKIAAAVQDAIVDAVCYKVQRAIKDTGIRTLCVAGGVSANRALRERLSAMPGIRAYFPPLKYCTDNGVMIAYAGFLRSRKGVPADSAPEVVSCQPVEEMRIP